MKLLLFGADGQVGWELRRSLAPLGEVVALDVQGNADFPGDLTDSDGLSRTIRAIAPDVIVNAAAYTQVDKAESEEATAHAVNAAAPAVMASEAARAGALLVHYSTDYVFDGSGSKPWTEEDTPSPLNAYGRTKLAGEAGIRSSGCDHLIFRTSWVYAARGANFIRSILRLAAERERLTIVNDQFGAPTGAELLADVTALAIRIAHGSSEKGGGVYNIVAAGETTWYEYASYVIERAAAVGLPLRVKEVAPVGSSEFKTAAARPQNSRLENRKAQQSFGVRFPPWREGVARVLDEILSEPFGARGADL